MKRRLTMAAAVLLFTGGLAATVSPAQALSYDGSDPAAMNCDDTASRKKSNVLLDEVSGRQLASLYLVYSTGCNTAWSRLYTWRNCGFNPGIEWPQDGCGTAYVNRTTDGREYKCEIPDGDTGCWTPQLYDGAGYLAYADAFVVTGAFQGSNGLYYDSHRYFKTDSF